MSAAQQWWMAQVAFVLLAGLAPASRVAATPSLSPQAIDAIKLPRLVLEHAHRPQSRFFDSPPAYTVDAHRPWQPIVSIMFFTPMGEVPLVGCSQRGFATIVQAPETLTGGTIHMVVSALHLLPLFVETLARLLPGAPRPGRRAGAQCSARLGIEWLGGLLVDSWRQPDTG